MAPYASSGYQDQGLKSLISDAVLDHADIIRAASNGSSHVPVMQLVLGMYFQ
jgi:hypothetical protein